MRKFTILIILCTIGLVLIACSFLQNNVFLDKLITGTDVEFMLVKFRMPINGQQVREYFRPWSQQLLELRTGYSGRKGGVSVLNGNLDEALLTLHNEEKKFYETILDPNRRAVKEKEIIASFPSDIAQEYLKHHKKIEEDYKIFKTIDTPIMGGIFRINKDDFIKFQEYWRLLFLPAGQSVSISRATRW